MRDIAQWLREHPLINVRKLERECLLAQGTIGHVLNGGRSFTDDHKKKLADVLKVYGY